MLQVLQDLKNGTIEVANVPPPQIRQGHLLVATDFSLISKGTEKMLMDFGKASFIGKARQQPDKVKMVLNKMKTDGLMPTLEAVSSKLNQPLPLGYSNVGKVIGIGEGVTGFSIGDRVVSNGHHAEVVSVAKNLCVKIPDGVTSEEASFTVLGAIGLQGVRLATPTLGENFVITGLGLIGLLTAQILQANGCRVLGFDFDPEKVELAKTLGVKAINPSEVDPETAANNFSRGVGVDGVIITASTKSSEPIMQAVEMCRKKGRIVLVGVTGMDLSRTSFFKKEVSFQVSCSYGPGRYDVNYEEKGLDYPLPYVRWTEQRNFSAILDLMKEKKIHIQPLISHRFTIENAKEAYEQIGTDASSSLGVILEYKKSNESAKIKSIPFVLPEVGREKRKSSGVSFIGAGNYASRFLMPAFHDLGIPFNTVVTNRGVGSYVSAKKFQFSNMASDPSEVFVDDSSIVVIGTRHDSHAEFALKALEKGKHVFVEKPLALNMDELEQLKNFYSTQSKPPVVMVGFNRRFSTLSKMVKKAIDKKTSPKLINIRVNAGAIPSDHWTQILDEGGRRLIGEGCHFVDYARFLAGHEQTHFQVSSTQPISSTYNKEDQFCLNIQYADGSLANIQYFSNGDKSIPKEQIEVHCDGMSFMIDNFRTLKSFGWKGLRDKKLWSQDKGQSECINQFVQAVEKGDQLISLQELFEVCETCIQAAETLRQ